MGEKKKSAMKKRSEFFLFFLPSFLSVFNKIYMIQVTHTISLSFSLSVVLNKKSPRLERRKGEKFKRETKRKKKLEKKSSKNEFFRKSSLNINQKNKKPNSSDPHRKVPGHAQLPHPLVDLVVGLFPDLEVLDPEPRSREHRHGERERGRRARRGRAARCRAAAR